MHHVHFRTYGTDARPLMVETAYLLDKPVTIFTDTKTDDFAIRHLLSSTPDDRRTNSVMQWGVSPDEAPSLNQPITEYAFTTGEQPWFGPALRELDSPPCWVHLVEPGTWSEAWFIRQHLELSSMPFNPRLHLVVATADHRRIRNDTFYEIIGSAPYVIARPPASAIADWLAS